MSAYEPPTAVYPIFDSLAFQTPNSASLTLAEGDIRYLARQNIATSNASLTAFAGDITIGNSKLDYTSGTGLEINGTANSESIKMNVLNGVGATKLKVELNPNHLHLYDDVRITDSSAPTNFTLLQQSTTTLNIDNGNVNSTTINLKTRTAGGASVTPLSLSSTAITTTLPLNLPTTVISYANNSLGYTDTSTLASAAATTSVYKNQTITIPTIGVWLLQGNHIYTPAGTNNTTRIESFFSDVISTQPSGTSTLRLSINQTTLVAGASNIANVTRNTNYSAIFTTTSANQVIYNNAVIVFSAGTYTSSIIYTVTRIA